MGTQETILSGEVYWEATIWKIDMGTCV